MFVWVMTDTVEIIRRIDCCHLPAVLEGHLRIAQGFYTAVNVVTL